MLVAAARSGAPDRHPPTWTEIAALLREDLATVLARYPHLVADPRTGPVTREETAAARAAHPMESFPPTIGRLRYP